MKNVRHENDFRSRSVGIREKGNKIKENRILDREREAGEKIDANSALFVIFILCADIENMIATMGYKLELMMLF